MASQCPVAVQEIDEVNDLGGSMKLAKKFDPPVNLKGLSLPKKKERLKLAVKKFHKQMKNVDALGEVLREKREEDRRLRAELVDYFRRFRAIIEKLDTRMRQHLEKSKSEMEPESEIDSICDQLSNMSNKLIVAGETSSGKSTLLNIFLNEGAAEKTPLLPVKLLSCTAVICEMVYNSERKAAVLSNGQWQIVPFEDRDKYIYKESEREEKFMHDLVRLELPSFFLKTGITLVDSPGVSEGGEIGSILKDFVRENQPFGFIFTLDSSRAGGVLPRFLNILQDLSSPEFVDKLGQRKFDPQSCIFVANKWDAVEEKDKENTKLNMYRELQKLPCMKQFKPEKQIFFMDAQFAYSSRAAGYISDDFSNFIDGLDDFVLKEQRRKLKRSHGWLENSINRLLHPVSSYILRMQQNQKQRNKKRDKTSKTLADIEKKLKQEISVAKDKHKKAIDVCSKQVFEFFRSEDALQRVTRWRSKDIPKEQYGDNWVIMEMKLDEAIDERVSEVLRDWEASQRIITSYEDNLVSDFQTKANACINELEDLERNLRNESGDIDLDMEPSTPLPQKLKNFKFPSTEEEDGGGRQFDVRYGQTWGFDIMANKPEAENLAESMSSGPVMKVLRRSKKKLLQKDKEKAAQNDAEEFLYNKVNYMTERASRIFATMCHSQYTTTLVTDQLSNVEKCIELCETETAKVINTNRRLIDAIANEKRKSVEVHDTYAPIQKDASQLLEDVLTFRLRYLSPAHFSPEDISPDQLKRSSASLYGTLHSGAFTTAFLQDRRRTGRPDITLKAVHLKASQKVQQEKYLRKYATRTEEVVRYLGLYKYQNHLVFVLRGKLMTARQYFSEQFQSTTTKYDVASFLERLVGGLQFLHLKNLVHPEVSLDSILIKQSGSECDLCPLLSNLLEPGNVTIPSDTDQPIRQYLALAPEVLLNGPYTWQADIYGVGIVMAELLCENTELFDKLKAGRLKDWIKKSEHEHTLRKELKKHLPEKYVSFVSKCIREKPSERISLATWHEEWTDIAYSSFK